eukprot:TRINITY_DN35790_c0_g1_i1.p1 TRINITY_DN35790_c0_g1~~TRINITY_DN35790_c0_g1_i1.p1  ORF type:complete len:238 (+),score=46.76 TRINITY_DN35790_c0_g1_i1:55-768(+)
MAETVIPDEALAQRLNWNVDEVLVWLQREGLGKLQPSFSANEVDGFSLLTAKLEDFRDILHVENRQDRRELMDAVQRLREKLAESYIRETGKETPAKSKLKFAPGSPTTPPHKTQMSSTLEQTKANSPLKAAKAEQEQLEMLEKKAERAAANYEFRRPVKTKPLLGNDIPDCMSPSRVHLVHPDVTPAVPEAAPVLKSPRQQKADYSQLIFDQEAREKERAAAVKEYNCSIALFKPE